MSRFNLVVLIVSSCLVASSWAANSCSITLPTDFPKFEPVVLTSSSGSNYELFKPTGQVTTLASGTKLLLACTGKSNTITSLSASSVELTCKSGSLVDSSGSSVSLSDLGCKSIPASSLQITEEPCANERGVIYNAGFEIDDVGFKTTFEICYDKVAENTYYTHNIINGAAINYNIKESTRRAFRADGMQTTTTATNKFYTTANQITKFNKYFGSSQTYVDKTNFIARGHLTPDADFVFSSEQLSTYFYSNVAPEYQVVNAGNWLRVESMARTIAGEYGDDLETYNGYMGVLELAHPTTGEMVTPYLDNNDLIEIPEYYFKVMKRGDAAVVMISINNPTETEKKEFCTNVCDEANISITNGNDFKKGYTFCCALDDFRNYYDGLPDDVVASSLLTRK